MIVQDYARDAEFQMRKALELKSDESAIIRDSDLNAIYPIQEEDKIPRCPKPNTYCWSSGFRTVASFTRSTSTARNPASLRLPRTHDEADPRLDSSLSLDPASFGGVRGTGFWPILGLDPIRAPSRYSALSLG